MKFFQIMRPLHWTKNTFVFAVMILYSLLLRRIPAFGFNALMQQHVSV